MLNAQSLISGWKKQASLSLLPIPVITSSLNNMVAVLNTKPKASSKNIQEATVQGFLSPIVGAMYGAPVGALVGLGKGFIRPQDSARLMQQIKRNATYGGLLGAGVHSVRTLIESKKRAQEARTPLEEELIDQIRKDKIRKLLSFQGIRNQKDYLRKADAGLNLTSAVILPNEDDYKLAKDVFLELPHS